MRNTLLKKEICVTCGKEFFKPIKGKQNNHKITVRNSNSKTCSHKCSVIYITKAKREYTKQWEKKKKLEKFVTK